MSSAGNIPPFDRSEQMPADNERPKDPGKDEGKPTPGPTNQRPASEAHGDDRFSRTGSAGPAKASRDSEGPTTAQIFRTFAYRLLSPARDSGGWLRPCNFLAANEELAHLDEETRARVADALAGATKNAGADEDMMFLASWIVADLLEPMRQALELGADTINYSASGKPIDEAPLLARLGKQTQVLRARTRSVGARLVAYLRTRSPAVATSVDQKIQRLDAQFAPTGYLGNPLEDLERFRPDESTPALMQAIQEFTQEYTGWNQLKSYWYQIRNP